MHNPRNMCNNNFKKQVISRILSVFFTLLLSFTLVSKVYSQETVQPAFTINNADPRFGIAGYVSPEHLALLNLPPSVHSYSWDFLMPDQKYNMVRPYKYWVSAGVCLDDDGNPSTDFNDCPQYWGWDDVIGQIGRNPADREMFRNYIEDNPGKIWIIGNEPDVEHQDNLDPIKYTYMYRYYYDFIRLYDPTAKFAIAGALGKIGNDLPDGHNFFTHVMPYYANVLTWYRLTAYGQDMPIDVWNTHIYSWENNPNFAAAEDYVSDFKYWVQNTSANHGGDYSNSDLIVTEFALNSSTYTREQSIQYMQNMTEIFKDYDFDKWFWFVSTAPPGSHDVNTRLYTAYWQPTLVGFAYADLILW